MADKTYKVTKNVVYTYEVTMCNTLSEALQDVEWYDGEANNVSLVSETTKFELEKIFSERGEDHYV